MQITYELSKSDFMEAYTAHRNGRALSRWSRRIFVGIIVLVVAMAVIGLLAKPDRESVRAFLPLFVLAAAWIAILWLLPRWTMGRQFLQQPGAKGPRTLTLDESGAHWQWNGGSSDVEWKNYIRCVEDQNQILFYTSPACFNIVPKRAMVPEQLDSMRELLRQNIRAAK